MRIPNFDPSGIPQTNPDEVKKFLLKTDTKKATAYGDNPAKIVKELAHVQCIPLSNLINASFKQGKWPTIYKNEIITPAPKQYPPVKRDMLRPISNLFNFDKTMEKIVGELVIMDMKEKLDPSSLEIKVIRASNIIC